MPSPTLQQSPNSLMIDHHSVIKNHPCVRVQLSRSECIASILERREALETATGALATWNPAGETGRIPKDTYIVRTAATETTVDWTSPTCIPMQPNVFDNLWQDALQVLSTKEELFVSYKTIGADAAYALRTQIISDHALPQLFVDNMFRQDADVQESVFPEDFTLLVLPFDKIETQKYAQSLRNVNGQTVDMAIVMDFERKMGLVYGLSYLGGIKKLMFTVMNYVLPEQGILPLHCSANVDAQGNVALFLGLSGTGKTTLSNHPGTKVIGDDEHGWSTQGVANFENGCYAKLMNLHPQKEPDIYTAAFTPRPVLENGVIIENALVYPNGSIDLGDDRHAENSRTSYPLTFLPNIVHSAVAGHPSTVIFLTADAKGVLPPVARLNTEQAMLWFLMGYTSKLAGTEVGVTEPQASFSRFFGGPFMPRQPRDYLQLFKQKITEHRVHVYLVNTGWTGGPYGIGKRMDIAVSRAVVDAALSGALEGLSYRNDTLFHIQVPETCPGVDTALLQPQTTWSSADAYTEAANSLAQEFSVYFDKNYTQAGLPAEVVDCCPGK